MLASIFLVSITGLTLLFWAQPNIAAKCRFLEQRASEFRTWGGDVNKLSSRENLAKNRAERWYNSHCTGDR